MEVFVYFNAAITVKGPVAFNQTPIIWQHGGTNQQSVLNFDNLHFHKEAAAMIAINTVADFEVFKTHVISPKSSNGVNDHVWSCSGSFSTKKSKAASASIWSR